MDERTYQELAESALRRIVNAFDEVDPDLADCERAGDVVTITLRSKERCIVNTQRAARQIWMAALGEAWHFSYSDAEKAWMDDKRPHLELFSQLIDLVRAHAGVQLSVIH